MINYLKNIKKTRTAMIQSDDSPKKQEEFVSEKGGNQFLFHLLLQ